MGVLIFITADSTTAVFSVSVNTGSRDNCVWKWPVIVCGFSIAGLFLPLLPGAGIVAGGIFLGLVMLIYVYFLVV